MESAMATKGSWQRLCLPKGKIGKKCKWADGRGGGHRDIQLQTMNLSNGTVTIRMEQRNDAILLHRVEWRNTNRREYQMISTAFPLPGRKRIHDVWREDAMAAVGTEGMELWSCRAFGYQMENPVLINIRNIARKNAGNFPIHSL